MPPQCASMIGLFQHSTFNTQEAVLDINGFRRPEEIFFRTTRAKKIFVCYSQTHQVSLIFYDVTADAQCTFR